MGENAQSKFDLELEKIGITLNEQQKQQFNQMASMEATRQANELALGKENLANQQRALAAQNAAFAAQQAAAKKAQEDANKQATLADIANKEALKSSGCLTRDPRMKERKKSGQPGARKRFQFSKR